MKIIIYFYKTDFVVYDSFLKRVFGCPIKSQKIIFLFLSFSLARELHLFSKFTSLTIKKQWKTSSQQPKRAFASFDG